MNLNNRNKMKKVLIVLGLILGLVLGPNMYKQHRRDSYVTKHVVQLWGLNKRGSCSGIHVNIDNKTYILSAAHCLVLSIDGKILVQDDLMKDPIPREVLMEDSKADLILLEALPGRDGISLASSVSKKDHLYTYTHGHGYATYKTEGSYIQDEKIEVPIFEVSETKKCETDKPKYVEKVMDFFFFQMNVCFLVENTMVTDALIAPGSSGGAVVNKYGELVGLVSAGNDKYGYLVPLYDLRDFTQNWK